MNFDTGQVLEYLKDCYGLINPSCKNLNTLAKYAFEVTSPAGHFVPLPHIMNN